MRSHTIAVIAAAAIQYSNIGDVQVQNATEKLVLGMPITTDNLRGQEFIGRLTQQNSKTDYFLGSSTFQVDLRISGSGAAIK